MISGQGKTKQSQIYRTTLDALPLIKTGVTESSGQQSLKTNYQIKHKKPLNYKNRVVVNKVKY